MLTTLQRLAKAKELALVGTFAGMATEVRRQVLLKRRAEGLRAVLLDRRVNTAADLDLFDREGSAEVIAAHLDSLSEEPLEVQGRAAAYLSIVAEHIDGAGRVANGPVMSGMSNMPDVIRRLHSLREYARTPGYREATYGQFRDAGSEAHKYKNRAALLLDAIKSIDHQAKEDKDARWAALAEKQVAIDAALRPYRRAFNEADDALYEYRGTFMDSKELEGVDPDEVARRIAREDELVQAKNAARAAYQAERDRLGDPDVEPAPDKFRIERENAAQSLADAGKRFTQLALESSTVTEAQATAWAAAQEISPSGRAKLKKLGYDPKQVRADMAEFYRLSGGRLAAIKIRASRSQRASAGEIHGPKTSVINLGQHFNKRVLFHEMAHHVEADPVALAAARGFLEAKRESSRLYTMRELTGNKAYGPKEVAFKDGWFDAYIGKDYIHNGQPYATEVFSMGLESFSEPEMLARRLAVDGDHFGLMLGFLKTPADPLYNSVKKVFQQSADAEVEAQEAADDMKSESIKRLTAGFTLEVLSPEPVKPDSLYYSNDYHYLGSYKDVDAWQVKDKALTQWVGNKRKRTGGFVIGRHNGPGGAEGRAWRSPFTERKVFGPLIEAMAWVRAWADGNAEAGNPDLSTPEKAKEWADRIEAARAAQQP